MSQSCLDTEVRFEDLGLSGRTLEALKQVNFETPSPIQAGFIPEAITGRDCTGQAQTGTGKTAAFVIPILERIDTSAERVQALVLTPTRELSEQVANEARRLSATSPCRCVCLVGGRPIRSQITDLRKGIQLAVGTPGRVIDLIQRKELILDDLTVVVLDEADRMLDIGFRPDIEKILRRCPTERQTLLLSATMPPPVERLAKRYMKDSVRIDLSTENVVVDTVDQHYATVDHERKFGLLTRVLFQERPQQAIVFTRTKRTADRLYRRFQKRIKDVETLHGDLPQTKRDRVMKKVRSGSIRLLIATDVVGRGIDVSGISHIINYDIPEFCDDYVHRIGRTGRLSSADRGCAITFVMRDQGDQLTNIEVRINKQLEEYSVGDFEAFKPQAPRKHVDDFAQKTVERETFYVA